MVRIGDSLKDQRVFITQSQAFMGPVLCKCFREKLQSKCQEIFFSEVLFVYTVTAFENTRI